MASTNLITFSGAKLMGELAIQNHAAVIPKAFSLQRRNLDNMYIENPLWVVELVFCVGLY